MRPADIRRVARPEPDKSPSKLICDAADALRVQVDAAVAAVFEFSWPDQRLTKIHQNVAERYQAAARSNGELAETYDAGGPPLTGTAWTDQELRHIVSFQHLVDNKHKLVRGESESVAWHTAVLGEIRSVLYAVAGTIERRYLIRFTNRAGAPSLPFVHEGQVLDSAMVALSSDLDAAISLQRLNSLQEISGLTAANARPIEIIDTIGLALREQGVEAFIALCHQRDSAQLSFARTFGQSCNELEFDLRARWADDSLYTVCLG